MIARRWLCSAALIVAGPLAAQPQSVDEAASAERASDIIVTAPRLPGAVIGDIPPEIELDEAAVGSYGASSLADLLGALSAQTGSARGRGNGPPVVLINGRRVAGFAEIRDLPTEAIARVQVLPEEVALKYGFAADQRVINFILKPGFKAVTAEIEHGELGQGGRGESEAQLSFVRNDTAGRLSLDAVYARRTPLLESERGIVQAGNPADGDARTLLGREDDVRFNATLNRSLNEDTALTVNARYERSTGESLFGRSLVGAVLARNTQGQTIHGGLTLDGSIGRWQWTVTGNVDDIASDTAIDTRTGGPRDLAATRLRSGDGVFTATGAIARLPAGPVRTTIRAGFDSRRLRSRSERGTTGIRSATLRRDEANARVTLDVPIADRSRNVASFLGKLSLNANAGYRRLSDFGRVTSFGYGLNWEPLGGLTLLASSLNEQAAPGIAQLGDPALATPGIAAFDFVRGETVLITRITGGNPALLREQRRDFKLSASYQPPSVRALTLSASYGRNRSRDVTALFPTLTPEIEAAFADRVTRNATGTLTAIDVRPVNFARTASDQLRLGINFSREFGVPPRGGADRPAGPSGGGRGGGDRPPGGSGGAGAGPGGGRGFGGGGFGGPGGQGGRWQAALYHTIRFSDRILIRPGVAELDLLRGSATGAFGGTPRHVSEIEGGWFFKGLGTRVTGRFDSATRVIGGASGDLRFSSLFTLNARVFVNFDSRAALIKRVPLLKGSRLALRVDNITGAIRDVRDAAGVTPINYQDGYIDPRGRFIELSFRKRF